MMDGIIMNDFLHHIDMKEEERRKLGSFIEKTFGIKMPKAKKALLEGRLLKRIRALKLRSYNEYYEYLFNKRNGPGEIIEMINEVSTNKTEFFREPKHFDYLRECILPGLIKQDIGIKTTLRIWSAGCSSGEEPYSIGMVIDDFYETQKVPHFRYKILATDIATKPLEKGAAGIYPNETLKILPFSYIRKYTMKNKDPGKSNSRIIPEIRERINFKRLNLMANEYNIKDMFHVIFCRNVFIYFKKDIQKEIISKLLQQLLPGGYLFIGHSESLLNLNINMKSVLPTIYRKGQ